MLISEFTMCKIEPGAARSLLGRSMTRLNKASGMDGKHWPRMRKIAGALPRPEPAGRWLKRPDRHRDAKNSLDCKLIAAMCEWALRNPFRSVLGREEASRFASGNRTDLDCRLHPTLMILAEQVSLTKLGI